MTEMLHRAYGHLAEMGFKYFATHQTVEQTRKRIETGSCLVAVIDSRIIGTITWYGHEPANPKWPQLYRTPGVVHFGQFGVEPEMQRHGIGVQLLRRVEQDARLAGCDTIALDTAAGATHLVQWYQRLGFVTVEYVQWEVTNYRSVIMRKLLAS
jgi:GNAT superfamily N-acetyltransferase